MELLKNKVTVIGTVAEKLVLSHEVYSEKFFTSFLNIVRASGTVDKIPFMVSERLVDIEKINEGDRIVITGEYRSCNIQTDDSHSKLSLNVFAKEIEYAGDKKDENSITLDGFICRQPKYRVTPKGRDITEVFLAVNRSYGKSDYIPSITWGRNAKYVGFMNVGDRLMVSGRIQSRKYNKVLEDGTSEERVAYEVSVSKISDDFGEDNAND